MVQIMGQMPPARLKPAPPFTSVMLDLVGPYPVFGYRNLSLGRLGVSYSPTSVIERYTWKGCLGMIPSLSYLLYHDLCQSEGGHWSSILILALGWWESASRRGSGRLLITVLSSRQVLMLLVNGSLVQLTALGIRELQKL